MYNINVCLKFEWDDVKAKLNQKKHGVSFDEAISVFYDELAIVFDDPDHSNNEERFIIVGYSMKNDILVVSHCWRESDCIIRIISARKATKNEYKEYMKFNGFN